ncbi:peptide ABC transporter permease [Candidatus Marinamargulisbacteria bacterium SCGC AG-333-B06]|nr:peptide ABC transporter permease [Candidatus Marinamargulisbacteria bacterium SCGC AG-333-B06]
MTLKVWISIGYLMGLLLISMGITLTNIDPTYINTDLIGMPQPPSLTHLFGTDELGRDIFIRSIFGARISLMVGFISVGISLVIGVFIGVLSGFIGGLVDEIIMRLIDVLMALPTLFLILIIQVILEPSIINIMIVIGATSWMGIARLVRAEVLSVKERVFVTAIRARGIQERKTLFKHIFPHTLNPIIVAAMLGMGGAILTESVLSFLGLGVQPPHPSWGNMLDSSLGYMRDAPWMALIPGILITCTVLSLNFLGDGLWLLLDPKAKDANVKRT